MYTGEDLLKYFHTLIRTRKHTNIPSSPQTRTRAHKRTYTLMHVNIQMYTDTFTHSLRFLFVREESYNKCFKYPIHFSALCTSPSLPPPNLVYVSGRKVISSLLYLCFFLSSSSHYNSPTCPSLSSFTRFHVRPFDKRIYGGRYVPSRTV